MGKLEPMNVGGGQRLGIDSHASVGVVPPLFRVSGILRDVNRDFDSRVAFANPLHRRFEIGVAGDEDDPVYEPVDGIRDHLDGDAHIGLLLLGDLVTLGELA